MKDSKKILIVEDEPFIAHDIKECCQQIGYQVVGIAGRSERALDMLHTQQPDAVILDITIKGEMDGIQLAEVINEKYQLPFIFLTSHADRGTLDRAKGAFPYGYILKPFDEKDLMTSLEVALFKHANLQPNAQGLPSLETINKSFKISEREYQIIQGVFEGWSNVKMASQFFVSQNTIKSHIRRIYSKFDVHNRSEMLKLLLTMK